MVLSRFYHSDIMVPAAQRPSEPPRYELYAVLYHHGESAGGGHYSVDTLLANRDGGSGEAWLHFDDEAVSAVHHENVFKGQGNERAADARCAYLLFYCRTTTDSDT
jgi:ubiquitin carboxyl-terminal hydrolase 10